MPSYQEFIKAAMVERPPAHPVFEFNSKLAGRALGEAAGVRVPALLQGPTSLRALTPPEGPAVVKPVNGCTSRGVFPLIRKEGGFRNLFTDTVMSWDEVVAGGRSAKHSAANEALVAREHPDAIRPPWIVEELILRKGRGGKKELPYDWKAFCFGGRVEAIWQSTRLLDGTVKVKWYDRDLKPVGDIIPHRKWQYSPRLPKPKHPGALVGAFEAVADLVESPFVRVDLFEDADGPVFGEITPHPTGATVKFVDEWDGRFGAAWANALA